MVEGRSDLVAMLTNHAIAADRTNRETTTRMVDRVAETLGSHRIVGLGEATHGSVEFFEVKCDIARTLIQDFGFRTFILEASFARTQQIDQYVRTGTGTAEDALDGLGLWTWNTDEMLEFVRWIREFNESNPPNERVGVVGVDPQQSLDSIEPFVQVLEDTDPAYLEEIETMVTEFDRVRKREQYVNPKEWLIDLETLVRLLEDWLASRPDHEERLSEVDYELFERHLGVLEQACSVAAARMFEERGEPTAIRDACMARNAQWAASRRSSAPAIVWAHNAHVATGTFDESAHDRAKRMGGHLKAEYDDEYYALGFEFGEGKFRAYPDGDTPIDLETGIFEVEPPVADSVPGLLSRVTDGTCFVDIDVLLKHEATRDWLQDGHPIHSIGAKKPSTMSDCYRRSVLAQEFDGLFFINRVRAT